MSLRTFFLVVVVALATTVLVSACGPEASARPENREAIQATLEAYLPRLAEAYTTRKFDGLKGLAADKEIAAVSKRIEDLARQGRVLEPEFKELAIEKINIWSHSNAYATTVETWDLKVYATGAHQLLSQELDQRNRVRYQLKRSGDGWLVLFRTIVE